MTVFNLAGQAERVRLTERLIPPRGPLTAESAEKYANQARLDGTVETLERETQRIIEGAEPEDFVDGQSQSWLRAFKRRIIEERKLRPGTPVDLTERLRQGNQLHERLGRYR